MSDDDPGGSGNLLTRLASVFAINRYTSESALAGMGFNRAATWVAMVSAITGGVIGLSTYRLDVNKQVDQSVAKTFDMITLYNSADMMGVRNRVLSYIYAKRECDARLIHRSRAPGDPELTNDDFIQILEFYDLVYACTESSLCDTATAQQFFGPHATFHWPILKDTVTELRTQDNTMIASMPEGVFARGMANFSDPDAVAPPCDGNF